MKTTIKNENLTKSQKEAPVHVIKIDPQEKYTIATDEEVLRITDELLEKHSAVFEALAK